ncbi:MAG TPA: phosphoribosylformylglycinamidine synthase, purS protein [Acidimicrobiaceae bacterium]|jgi:phosphoribosylformylglycinamidine synthase|nr:phosphoribosylformylglycinamidine synthase, purS protein [Acidimicrobiaceae bacterium]MDP7258875.1 phosphoribosylformylglycinamidine synthase subunit PurS [Acidimicrobiales bacterium]HCV36564.1 phosphoribosylformylglycinamidine synthase, purS protein [Acidimicrobiaceae bacterium]HJO80202.1 phosphoribosylformylglycinamidine synthase subunit PurS [Acidimicrobiales bacterium]|tara:strand:+ start:18261 stop:18524 length:264 start_codon:yes stop_codon:yes gene_type:complete
MKFTVLVDVRLRSGIADPAGATIERAIPVLGFAGVSGVSVGKIIRFTIEAVDKEEATIKSEELSTSFLTNPVIEDAVVTLSSMDDDL